MKKRRQHFETREHDLTGHASVDLYEKDFNVFGSRLVKYNPDRFDAVALKVFVKKGKPVVTLFAVDKYKQEESSNYPKDKLPVKKFKVNIEWSNFIASVKQFDFVVSNEAYDIDDILVLNK
jgi:hypothetical protein